MPAISTLEQAVADILEESYPSPVFWSLQDEIRVALVEAMNEMTLLTGEPEQQGAVTLTANQTIQTLPVNMLALLKLWTTTGVVPKTSMEKLDNTNPGWEAESGTNTIKSWFAFGLGKIGIYPKLSAPPSVTAAFVPILVTDTYPYDGTQSFDFQNEYQDLAIRYAGDTLRLKEGGQEFFQGANGYAFFIEKIQQLSAFASRKGAIRFTRAMGSVSEPTEVKEK